MRWTVMLVAGLLAMGGAVAGLLSASAQQYVVPQPVSAEAVGDLSGDDAPRPPAGQHRMQGWQQGHQPGFVPAALGLLFTAPDRQLSQADVQKIAEAYLVWHGNHDWRVTKLSADADRVVFTVTTGAGAVVASFAMDRHSGALVRTG